MFSKKKYRCILSTALALGLLTTLVAGCSGEPVSPSSTLSTPNSNATQTQISSRTPIASQTKSVSPGITHSSATGSASHPSAATYSVGSPTVPSTTKGDTTPSVTLPQENAVSYTHLPVIQSQLREYEDICAAAADMARRENSEAKGVNALAKISSYLSVNMNTMIDKTSSHLAEMMMQGSNMGVIEITQKLKEFADADEEVLSLGRKLLKTEERNLEQLKKYL